MKSKKYYIFTALSFLLLFSASRYVYAQNNDCKEIKNKKAIRAFDDAVIKFQVHLNGQAVNMLKEAINIEPDYVDAYFLLGLIYVDENYVNTKLAKQYLLKAIEMCPTYNIYCYYYLADIFFGEKDFAKAAEYYSIFLEDVDKIESDEDYKRASDLHEYSKFLYEMYSNPVPFDPIFVQGISTEKDEYLPIISPDNEIALYTRKTLVPSKRKPWEHGEVYKESFMLSYKQENVYGEGKELPAPFNQEQNEGGATLTIDNNHLYYTVCKFAEIAKGTYYNCDIYTSDYIQGKWSELKNLGRNVNSDSTWESQPSISSDGKTLFFTSDRQGGIGGYDIYKTVKNEKGEWQPAQNLGRVVNTKGNEKSPFIHTDSQTLYFSSDGLMGLGGYDIFYSKLKEDNTWQKPINIGYPINTNSDEVSFFVSTDGRLGYFASNKYNGPGGWDLYSFNLYEDARPEKVLFIKGNVTDEIDEKVTDAKVLLKNVETKKVEEIKVDSLTGKYVIARQFENDFVISVKKDGYAQKSKYISKEDTIFEAPQKIELEVQKLEVGKAYTLDDIYYAHDSDQLTEDSKIVLNEFVLFLKDNPNIEFEILGHTDNTGNDAYNLNLSKRRAESVFEYIVSKGIEPDRMTHNGFGENKPVASNDTPEGKAKNRRTEFVIKKF